MRTKMYLYAACAALAGIMLSPTINLDTSGSPLSIGIGTEAYACNRKVRVCGPRPAPNVPTYRGTNHRPAKITVTVCHPYWNQLEEKWWGPALADTGNKESWIKLKAHRKPCKQQSGFPGFRIGTKASCLGDRWIWTARIYKSGTYDMTLTN